MKLVTLERKGEKVSFSVEVQPLMFLPLIFCSTNVMWYAWIWNKQTENYKKARQRNNGDH